MDHKPNLFDFESLAFFGRVNASISHELKNIMAIISETAGLLSDLSEMARKGGTIELDMLTDSTQSIVEEIQRGFTTIRQMNRFSHSIDTPIVSIDLREILDLVARLSEYLAFAGKMNISPVEGDAPMVKTCPFILQAIIYEAAVRIFKETGPKANLSVSIQPIEDSAWQIAFTGLSITKSDTFLGQNIKKMAASIGVFINHTPSDARLEIQVPISIKEGAVCSESNTIPAGHDR
ncbi:MAG: HAMP domain-containing histidine kinase [Desulfobacter sp.]|nr:MAG: HAMP domain-containing histidine kinase [Desulfobacter sp.]